jgi:hypothetical protein
MMPGTAVHHTWETTPDRADRNQTARGRKVGMDPGQHAVERRSPFAERDYRANPRIVIVAVRFLRRERPWQAAGLPSENHIVVFDHADTPFSFFPFHSSKCFQPGPLPNIMRVKVV